MNENNRVDEMIKIKENNEGRNDEWIRFVNDEPISLICDELNISRFALYRRIRNIKKKLRKATKTSESSK